MKKKKIIIISLLILITIIFVLVYIFIRSRLTIKGIIVECYENTILVYEEKSKTLTDIGLPQNINLKFKLGQEVRIYLSYDACITLTYPASIDSKFIKKIKIISKDGNTQIVEDYNTQKQERLLEFERIHNQLQENK